MDTKEILSKIKNIILNLDDKSILQVEPEVVPEEVVELAETEQVEEVPEEAPETVSIEDFVALLERVAALEAMLNEKVVAAEKENTNLSKQVELLSAQPAVIHTVTKDVKVELTAKGKKKEAIASFAKKLRN